MKFLKNLGWAEPKCRVFIMDSTSTTGAGKTGLTTASSGLAVSTITDNESTVTEYTVAASNLETITTIGTWAAPSTNKCRFKEIDSSKLAGWYELQFAAARANVSNSTLLQGNIYGATGMAPVAFEIQLEPVAVNVVQWIGSLITESAVGRFIAGMKQFFDIASPTSTMNNVTSVGSVSGAVGSVTGNVGGNVVGSIGSVATGGITAGSIAADAIGASEIAADAVAEIQSGLATTAHVQEVEDKVDAVGVISTAIEADTQDIQARLPATLSGGRMRSQVEAIDSGAITAASIASNAITAAKLATDAIGAAQLAADAITEIQSGLATAAGVSAVEADTQDIQNRLPAALVSGRMDSNVQAMADGVITAAKLATDAITAAKLAADAIAEIQSGLSTLTAMQVNAEMDTALADYGAAVPGDTMKIDQSELYPVPGAEVPGSIGEALQAMATELGDESVVGLEYTKKTPAGDVAAVFDLDDADAPTSRTRQ